MQKKNKYRSKSLRLQHWDYAWNSAYFVTICTHKQVSCFGEIVDDKMQLSSLGIIADILWYEIKNHIPNCELGEFVMMPNHLHGILVIDNPAQRTVDTRHALYLQSQPISDKAIGAKRFQNQGKHTLSSIIGSYKSAVTKHAHRLGYDFQWQRNYWEHIVRNDKEHQSIADYIRDNPKKWSMDKLNGGEGNRIMEDTTDYNLASWQT